MRFHLSKGIRDWPELAKEIAVIVIGVLIALGFEQGVEELHWRNEVRQGEDGIRDESLVNYAYSVEQVMVTPCILAQIDTLIGLVQNSGDRLTPAPTIQLTNSSIPRVLSIPVRNLQYQQWQALQQSSTVSHMDRYRQLMLSMHYTNIRQTTDLREKIMTTRNRLDVLSAPIELDPQVKANLLDLLHQAKGDMVRIRTASRSIIYVIETNGFAPTLKQIGPPLSGSAKTGTIRFCKVKGLPLADWQKEQLEFNANQNPIEISPVGK